MKLLNIFFFTLSATFAIFSATTIAGFDKEPHIQTELIAPPSEIQPEQTSLRGMSRFLAQQNLKPVMTCDKFPRICRQKNGSPGPDCCKKKCVNVKKDRSLLTMKVYIISFSHRQWKSYNVQSIRAFKIYIGSGYSLVC